MFIQIILKHSKNNDYFQNGNSRKIEGLNDFDDVNKMIKIGGSNDKN